MKLRLMDKLYVIIYVLFFNFIYLPLVLGFDYCGATICNGSEQHTLCKYKEVGPLTRCLEYQKTILGEGEKRNLLEKLNRRRNIIAVGEVRSFPSASNMRKLVWNEDLAQSAQRWADQCVESETYYKHDECRDLENFKVGQNIATIVGDAPGLTPASLVDVWYMELMNLNSSIIGSYSEPFSGIKQDYFTQLMWANTYLVGCGGVKFKENSKKIQTVHRLVCNFAPKGNIVGESVYEEGIPCTNCPEDSNCDEDFVGLCETITEYSIETTPGLESKHFSIKFQPDETDPVMELEDTLIGTEQTQKIHLNIEEKTDFEENMTDTTNYDYISDILQFNKQIKTNTTETQTTKIAEEKPCKSVIIVDELLNLLRKKLINDPNFTHVTAKENDETQNNADVNDILRKLYKNDVSSTTTQNTIKSDILNSSLLVDLVEAVIFRNTGIHNENENDKTTELTTATHPAEIKHVKAEIASVPPNNDFDGHYFFPEDEDVEESDDNRTTDKIDTYYEDVSTISSPDILAEINNIRSKTGRHDFLEDILETDIADDESEITTFPGVDKISPDDLSLFKKGYKNMKIFLQEIGETRGRTFSKK